MMNTPVSDEAVVRDTPVSTCVAVTATPGSAAPLSSTTVPRRSACATCAAAGKDTRAAMMAGANRRLTRII
jgi:hypothetical protein